MGSAAAQQSKGLNGVPDDWVMVNGHFTGGKSEALTRPDDKLDWKAASELQMQPEDRQTEAAEDAMRSVMATTMGDAMPEAEGAEITGDAAVVAEPWTAFDQLAVEQGDLNDSLDWGVVVSSWFCIAALFACAALVDSVIVCAAMMSYCLCKFSSCGPAQQAKDQRHV